MKNILTLIKKELHRVFKDRRLMLTIFLLPGLMIFLMYNLMGDSISKMNQSTISHQSVIHTYNMPEEFETVLKLEVKDGEGEVIFKSPEIKEITDISNLDELKNQVKEKEIDLIIIFADNFSDKLINGEYPKIDFYYNSTNDKSVLAYDIAKGYLSIYNIITIETTPIFDTKTAVAGVMTGLMPFLIITLLFSGITSIAPESIAGEKERGTIATLLITPVKRGEVAIGKVLSLSILSLFSAVSSFIGVLLSMNKIVGTSENVATMYNVADYLLILLLLFATVLLLVGLVSIISAFAKTVKEASMYILPVMFLSMLVSISSMFSTGATTSAILYLVPIYNTVQSLTQIFALDINLMHLGLCIGSNLLYTAILTYILTKMFNSEKIMFNK